MRERELFYDGQWVGAANRARVQIHDPATGDIVGSSAVASDDDVHLAVTTAASRRRAWRGTHPDERATILHAAADLIEARVDDIARTLTLEQGKPIPDSAKEIRFGVEVLRYYAEEGRRVAGSLRQSTRGDIKSVVDYEPVGVVGAIVPWNYPVDLYMWKVAPALAAGCPVVAKPPTETPLAIGEVVRCFQEAGLPDGILADLPGDAAAGRALVAHPDVALITVTASVDTGRAIMRSAADRVKRLSLELGGHTPFIVLDDADIEDAVAGALRRSYSNMGQICIAVNRILVADRVADDFVEAFGQAAGALELGHGVDEGVTYGPVLNQTVIDRAQRHVTDAVDRGGRLVVGGGRPDGAAFERGHFYRPTVLDQVPIDAVVLNEETYGPVAAIHRCPTDAELLEKVNALPYGLAAYLYSSDLERAWAFADEIEAGAVGINVNDVTELQAPFGGWKLSGLGRELGIEGLHTYLEPRHVRMRVRPLAGPGG